MYDTILNIFDKYKNMDNIEIEFRFGWKGNSTIFSSDIGDTFYEKIKEQLDSCVLFNDVVVYKSHDVHYKDIRKSVFEDHDIHIQKIPLLTHDVPLLGTPYDLRISVCQEIPCTLDINCNVVTFSRSKYRKSYNYKCWSYDLSHTTIDSSFVDMYTNTNKQFHFEIEYIPNSNNFDNQYLTTSIISKIEDIANIPL